MSLIEVPKVKERRSARLRRHVRGADPIARLRERSSTVPRRRRRLRREIRVGGCALLLLAPLLSACTVGWSNGPVRVLSCSITEATAAPRDLGSSADGALIKVQPAVLFQGSPGDIVLSNESAESVPNTETAVPVIFPGYVLPDDSREGAAHEGS